MDRDALAQLIRAADREAGVPRVVPGLAARVGQRAVRSSRFKASGAAVAALLVFALGSTWLVLQPVDWRDGLDITEVRTPSELKRELASLRGEAEARIALVRRLQAVRKDGIQRSRRHARSLQIDAGRNVRRQLDRAAFTIVYTADRLRQVAGLVKTAVVQYEQVLSLCPQTQSAETGRRRLAEIQDARGENS